MVKKSYKARPLQNVALKFIRLGSGETVSGETVKELKEQPIATSQVLVLTCLRGQKKI